jgi:hypothetical protein
MDNATTISRRRFLLAGSGLLASSWLLGPNWSAPANALGQLAATAPRRLSVGYVEGSAGTAAGDVAALLGDSAGWVRPATSMRAERSLVGELAAVRLAGLSSGSDAGGAGLELDALIRSPDRLSEELLPYYAWTLRPGSGGTVSNTSSFVTTVEAEPSLGLTLRIGGNEGSQSAESVAVFTGGGRGDLFKLRRGVYLLGLEPRAWDRGRALTAPGGTPPSLVLSVDAGAA